MTATNGWPDKPGVPVNPEKDGWHWLEDTVDGVGTGHIEAMYYAAFSVPTWYGAGNKSPITKLQHWRYLGPVLTPDEAAKREDVKWHEGYAVGVLDVRRGTAFGEPDTHYAALQKRIAELEAALAALQRDASQQVATDEMVRRLQHLGDWQAADRIEALQKRVAELEAQNDMLRHATDKLRAMLAELNARHEPLQRAFITAVELLNDAALEGKKDD